MTSVFGYPYRSLKALAWRIFRSNLGRLNHPFKLTFALTWRCNSRCSYCQIWRRPAGRELSTEEIARFFRRNPHFSWIDLTGGEVFLRPDLVEIARAIKKHCPEVFLLHAPSNGLLPDLIGERVAQLKELRFPKLIFSLSLDGPPELHDRLRGVPGGWLKVTQTYKKLKALGVEAYFGLTLGEENIGRLAETFGRLKEEIPGLGWRDLHLNIIHASEHYYGNLGQTKVPAAAQVAQVISRFRRERGWSADPVFLLEDLFLKNVPRYLKTGRTPRPCQAASGSFFLDPEGQVYPCSLYNRLLGDLRQADLDLQKIWQKPETLALRQAICRGDCPQCWTPCESYQGILGSFLRPGARRS